MKNKNLFIYTGILLSGLLLGYFLFGNATNNSVHNHNEISNEDQMWTCSMHPQIMKSEAGDCPICGMDLIPTDNTSSGLMAGQFKLTENAMALANIQTSIIGEDNKESNTINISGKIEENEESNTVQVSYFSGRIERLNISATGERIRKGQLIATIYSPELLAAQQELITTLSIKETQPKLYEAVRNKLKLWKISENQINQIERSGKIKDNFPIYANVSGTVLEKLVEEGAAIKQGQPLFKITNLNTVWALFDVYESQVDLFKKGQEISIKTTSNKNITAKVDFIDPVLNTKTRTVKLRVILNNKTGEFKPGMFVQGEIKGFNLNKEKTLMIPVSAVLWTGKRSVVYVKVNNNEPVFEMYEITLGNKIGSNYEVLKGLSFSDEIVTNGTFTVDAAAQLQGKKSMMNREGGKMTTGHENHLEMKPDTKETASKSKVEERIEVAKSFQNQLSIVFSNYIELKDALVKDESNLATASSIALLTNISKVEMKLLTDNEAHLKWMSLEKEIKLATTFISKASDIDEQRNYFKNLSLYLITAIKVFGINEKVFVEFCPMANSNKGAYWLSKEEKVINPYYGDKMLTCGEVKEILE